MPAELKNCPFCGYKVDWGDGGSESPCYPEDGAFEGEEIFTIACPNCGAGVAPGGTLDEAISNWNRRADTMECANLQAHNSGSNAICPKSAVLEVSGVKICIEDGEPCRGTPQSCFDDK